MLKEETEMGKTTKIVATITGYRQVSADDFVTPHSSRVFSINRPISDLINFAREEGQNPVPDISDIVLSVYTGESL